MGGVVPASGPKTGLRQSGSGGREDKGALIACMSKSQNPSYEHTDPREPGKWLVEAGQEGILGCTKHSHTFQPAQTLNGRVPQLDGVQVGYHSHTGGEPHTHIPQGPASLRQAGSHAKQGSGRPYSPENVPDRGRRSTVDEGEPEGLGRASGFQKTGWVGGGGREVRGQGHETHRTREKGR